MALFGSILSTVTAVAEAAAAYYRNRQISEAYHLIKEIEKDIIDDENEILRLRALPDDGSQRIADRLCRRLIRRQGLFTHVSAANPALESGDANPDSGGDLHPPV